MTRTTRAGRVTVVAALTAVVTMAGCGSLSASWAPAGSAAGGAAPTTRVTPLTEPVPTSDAPAATWHPPVSATAAPTPRPTPSSRPSPTTTATDAPARPEEATRTPRPEPTRTTKPAEAKKPRTTLVRGDSGPKVLQLQERLTELGYWLGKPDGSFGSLTQQAVWALQKSAGLRRDGVVGPRTARALADGIRPKATITGDGVEIDLDRQVLLVVRGGRVQLVLNTSTGNGEQYTSTAGNKAIATTPKGTFAVYRAVDGPLTNSLGQLWRPLFFHRGFAVHGSPNVPPWPASHGCARLTNAAVDMIWADRLMPNGSTVVVR